MKKWNVFILAVFAIPIFAMAVWSLCDTDATVSVTENRTLASAPELSGEAWFSGDWPSSFGEYYADTFPLRETLLSYEASLNSFYLFSPFRDGEGVSLLMPGINEADLAEGGESIFDLPGELRPDSDDGNSNTSAPPQTTESAPPNTTDEQPPDLPPAEQSESPPPDVQPETPPPPPDLPDNSVNANTGRVIISGGHAIEIVTRNDAALGRYADMLANYAAALPDSQVYSLIAPSSAAFNAPSDYRTGLHDQEAMINYIYDRLGSDIRAVDAYGELRLHSDEYLYFRSDHHWTQLGAYYAYRAYCTAAELEPFELTEFETGQIDGFIGSLYSHTKQNPASKVLTDNPDTVYTWRPVREFQTRIYPNLGMSATQSFAGYVISNNVNVSNKYLAFIAGDNPLTVIETDVAGGRSCIVLKESFGNAFVPFLVNHYSKVYVIDPRKFNGEGKPSARLDTFVAEHEIDDVIVINYPFALNATFAAILDRMVGK